MNEI
jgi:serine/threonine protein kinase